MRKLLPRFFMNVDDLVNVYDETIARDDAESDVKNSLLFISS